MPRIDGTVERRERLLYDTEEVRRGEVRDFFVVPGELQKTNLVTPGRMPRDESFIVKSVGLRLLLTDPAILDYVVVELLLGDLPLMQLPGDLCSLRTMKRGYELPEPVELPERLSFYARLYSRSDMPLDKVVARVLLFGVRKLYTR